MERAKLLAFAQAGARARMAEITTEMRELRALLARAGRVHAPGRKAVATRRRTMTAAQRKAVSVRMRRYWRARRAAAAG